MGDIGSINFLNWVSLIWFVTCWVSYTQFSKYRGKTTASLSSVLHVHRINWMRRLLGREVRVADASLLANIERNVNFFASSCVLIMAGLLTAMTAVDELEAMLANVSFVIHDSLSTLELKMATLIGIFIYAFFTFTWSMRQFGFASVLVGAAPAPGEANVTAADRRSFAIYAAKVIDQASRSYNYGLRAFYFSLGALAWFIHPFAFMGATLLVVFVLYKREFLSNSLYALMGVENVGEKVFKDDKELSDF
ncbi:MAG: hypothetical protein CMI02_11225 [Oceanospirillaceae bacterium]|nr:hypothetical protein [Oceanospirillaceae bacterium]MBT12592.1 hypothetical protein [Oceanospirillaceae bacterium]|tara:strand:+ start:102694 stop:103443 length:750 start_codon:yes stop_codon:yes gene_type:complete